jgi:hypothetical protein
VLRLQQAGQVAGRRRVWAAGLAAVAGCVAAACSSGSGAAGEFCTGYANALHDLVVAARQYNAYPANFASIYESTMDRLTELRRTAPDDKLRSAFDTAAFTFSVFGADAGFADFLTRADFSENAVVRTCSADYGVDVKV